jgi:hypothetical protein
MIPQTELEVAVRKTVLLYNRLKSPEAIAKVISISPEIVTISLAGTFCVNCAVPLNYIEDFAKDFKVFNNKIELKMETTRLTSKDSVEINYLVIPR